MIYALVIANYSEDGDLDADVQLFSTLHGAQTAMDEEIDDYQHDFDLEMIRRPDGLSAVSNRDYPGTIVMSIEEKTVD